MLLQSENGIMDFFPAVPEEWLEETVSFTGLRAEGGLIVSAVLEKGLVSSLKIKGAESKKLRIRKSAYVNEFARKQGWTADGNCWIVE